MKGLSATYAENVKHNTMHTWGWKGSLVINYSKLLCPIRFCVPLKKGTPQWSRVACSSTQSCLPSEKVLYLNGILGFSVCAWYFSCPSTALYQEESLMPSSLLPDIYTHYWNPPSLPFAVIKPPALSDTPGTADTAITSNC